MPRFPSSKRNKEYRTRSPYSQKPAKEANPLLFPDFQCKLAGLLLKLEHTPEDLSKIFETEPSLELSGKKSNNQHRIAASFINEWVISQGQPRPKVKDVVDLFHDDHTKRELKIFSKNHTKTKTKLPYPKCSKGPKSFKLIKLIITKAGNIIGICPSHGIPKKGKWCYYRSYNGDTIDESETSRSRPLVPTSCSPTTESSSQKDTSNGESAHQPIVLTGANIHTICEGLKTATYNWFDLGLAFGVKSNDLKNIEDEYRHNKRRLMEMIDKRLEVTDPEHPMTWPYICECLRSPTVERNDVAEKIEDKYVRTATAVAHSATNLS